MVAIAAYSDRALYRDPTDICRIVSGGFIHLYYILI